MDCKVLSRASRDLSLVLYVLTVALRIRIEDRLGDHSDKVDQDWPSAAALSENAGTSETHLKYPVGRSGELADSLMFGSVPSKANLSTLQPEGDPGNCICHLH